MKKEPESNIYSIIQNEVEIYDNTISLFYEKEYQRIQENLSKIKSIESEAYRNIFNIQEIHSTFTGQKQTKELLLTEEYNSERISTNESNEKSYIIVSNSGHVYRRRKERRLKNETIEDYNNNQTKLKTLYNNQKELEHNITKITEGINNVLLEKEISTRKKLLSKAIVTNRKKQELIKKNKLKEYLTNKINKETKPPSDSSQLITFFSSCGPIDEESDENENKDNCTLV